MVTFTYLTTAANSQKSLYEQIKIWLLRRLRVVRQTMNNWLHAPNVCNHLSRNFRLPLTYRNTNNWRINVQFYFFVCTGAKFGLPPKQPTQMQSPAECAYELSAEERSLIRNTRFSIITQHKQHSRRFESSCFRKVVSFVSIFRKQHPEFFIAWRGGGGDAKPQATALHNLSLTKNCYKIMPSVQHQRNNATALGPIYTQI